ncbi:hypothetical protein NDU88_008252 [Pleurodeles waltl]|uniref:Uncharacterized protein n=1 Tax=Pleurodeles waltl TaxID=8319 RepID=A0AAV7PNM9_PLEWA|nr:hypothetical protein NDU88_008252 [Pleurodeles waltl]
MCGPGPDTSPPQWRGHRPDSANRVGDHGSATTGRSSSSPAVRDRDLQGVSRLCPDIWLLDPNRCTYEQTTIWPAQPTPRRPQQAVTRTGIRSTPLAQVSILCLSSTVVIPSERVSSLRQHKAPPAAGEVQPYPESESLVVTTHSARRPRPGPL